MAWPKRGQIAEALRFSSKRSTTATSRGEPPSTRSPSRQSVIALDLSRTTNPVVRRWQAEGASRRSMRLRRAGPRSATQYSTPHDGSNAYQDQASIDVPDAASSKPTQRQSRHDRSGPRKRRQQCHDANVLRGAPSHLRRTLPSCPFPSTNSKRRSMRLNPEIASVCSNILFLAWAMRCLKANRPMLMRRTRGASFGVWASAWRRHPAVSQLPSQSAR